MPKSRVRKKNGKKVKYQAPKKKQFSMKDIQKITELLKNMQAAQQNEVIAETPEIISENVEASSENKEELTDPQ